MEETASRKGRQKNKDRIKIMKKHIREQPRTILLTLGRTGRLAGVRNPYFSQRTCTFLKSRGILREGTQRTWAVSADEPICRRGMP